MRAPPMLQKFVRVTIVLFFSVLLVIPARAMEVAVARKTTIITWNQSTTSSAHLEKDGSLTVGGRTFKSRYEGQGSGPQNFTIVAEPTSSGGKALHYLVTSQEDGHKGRAEHYLHIEPLNATFYSEFSLKLDSDFTKVDTKRPDGGPNWCILRQWHQGIGVPPPLALMVKNETNNVLVWRIISGDKTGHGHPDQYFGEKLVELNHWYHFSVKWNISPDENGECVVKMGDTRLPRELTDKDILFSYKGPIGYTVDGWNEAGVPINGTVHAPNTVREQQGIYQGPHVDPGTHHGFSVDNVDIYSLSTN